MRYPQYPYDYFDFSDGVDVDTPTIDKYVKDAIDYLMANPDESSYEITTGNTIILATTDGHGLIDVTVSKCYQQASYINGELVSPTL